MRILQDADGNDVPSIDTPPDATSSVTGDVPAAPAEEPAGVPSQNEGNTFPSGSHGKTIVGYYAVSSAYFIVRSSRCDCATCYCSFRLHSRHHYLAKKSWQWYDRNNKASPESMDFKKVQRGKISSLSAVARNSYIIVLTRLCTVLLRGAFS